MREGPVPGQHAEMNARHMLAAQRAPYPGSMLAAERGGLLAERGGGGAARDAVRRRSEEGGRRTRNDPSFSSSHPFEDASQPPRESDECLERAERREHGGGEQRDPEAAAGEQRGERGRVRVEERARA